MAVDIITAVGTVMATLKNLHELSEKEQYAKVKEGIADMSVKLSDMTVAAYAIRDENTELKNEIKRLKEFEDRGLTMGNDRAYYDKNKLGPYCPTCYDNRRFLSLMHHVFPHDDFYTCPQCKYKNN